MPTPSPLWTLASVAVGSLLTFLVGLGLENRRARVARAQQLRIARARWRGQVSVLRVNLESFNLACDQNHRLETGFVDLLLAEGKETQRTVSNMLELGFEISSLESAADRRSFVLGIGEALRPTHRMMLKYIGFERRLVAQIKQLQAQKARFEGGYIPSLEETESARDLAKDVAETQMPMVNAMRKEFADFCTEIELQIAAFLRISNEYDEEDRSRAALLRRLAGHLRRSPRSKVED